jgi:hypothetical protein
MATLDDVRKGAQQAGDWAGRKAVEAFTNAQARLDVITQKAYEREQNATITSGEKWLLTAVYNALWAGGHFKGLPEAAQLLGHYLAEWGTPLEIDSKIYQDSGVVKKEMERQKQRARAEMQSGKAESKLASGRLLADHARLKYADNRFILTSTTVRAGPSAYLTTWRVDNSYDFEDFHGTSQNWRLLSKWSEFPFQGQKLKIYDGLSRYLVALDMAEEFDYFATWAEMWAP